ncbi:hypothetical protein TCAL_08905 [Tigriopus californicus]|uniref:Sulfotransferase domain-containing protein n=2 Tax=Tigriopus californicus TaxID=6832 RepID=A0A553NY96_TIGCA|nr:hypothetical protein TCAL_08905 [Tigriopus californicus]
MANELSILNTITSGIEKRCIADRVNNYKIKGKFKLYGDGNMMGFQLKNGTDQDCETYVLSEVKFLDLNIFLRYAYGHDLNVALPRVGNHVGRNRPFHRSVLWDTPWDAINMTYNFYCLHGIWNFDEVNLLMGPGTKYITILRDPIELFISMWDYVNFSKSYKVTLEEYALSNKTGLLKDRKNVAHLGQNQMLLDSGVPGRLLNDQKTILDKINELDRTFDLVMIAEHYNESVILLKDLLCWDYKDVASLKMNSRKKSAKSTLSAKAREALKEYLAGDYMLYNHFLTKFKYSRRKFGETKMANK